MAIDKRGRFVQRQNRTRNQLRSRGGGRCRLTVFCSSKNVYAQVIDDRQGRTLAHASTLESGLGLRGRGTRENAKRIGTLVAERAMSVGVEQVVFDRGGYRYHGRVRDLADAAREAGLQF